MSNLVTVNSAVIYNKTIPVLQNYKDIAGAVHFGSSLGKCRPDSDIDVGLIMSLHFPTQERKIEKLIDNISNDLGFINDHDFDNIVVNSLPSIFAFRVIKDGHLFYQEDPEVVTELIEQVSRRYAEDYSRYRSALRLVVEV